MTVPLVIKVDADEALGYFDRVSRQVPFATSRAINEALKSAQGIEQQHVLRSFTVRRPDFIIRTLKITQFADKRTLTGVLEVDPTRDMLAKFEEGGRKTPISGSALAVPIAVRRNKSDIVLRSMRIRNLGLTAHRTQGGKVQLKGKFRTFTIKGPQGGAVLQRVGRKPKGSDLASEISAGSVRVLYAFKRSVPIRANLRFTENVSKAVVEQWPKFMTEAFDFAVRTAR